VTLRGSSVLRQRKRAPHQGVLLGRIDPPPLDVGRRTTAKMSEELSKKAERFDTMRVWLAYGRDGLYVRLPDGAHVIEPQHGPALATPLETVRQALAGPLGTVPLKELLDASHRVCIVHSDGTRPMPGELLLKALMEVFSEVGIPDSQITLLNALGTHRLNTREELIELVGEEALCRYRSEQSRSTEAVAMRTVGRLSDGTAVELHRAYVDADFRIVLGFIEPHFFAGFSGGPKSVVPGVASQRVIQHVHRAELVGHPQATWGVLDGNPLWETLYEGASLCPPDFIINVALNKEKKVTAVFAGSLDAAHRAGVSYVKKSAMRAVPKPFDVVVTTNSGYPLDQNLYQTVKGMSAAAQIVRPGGAIIMAAECADGIPDHGAFGEIVKEAGSAERILELVHSAGHCRADQWQAQVLAQVLQKARVYLYSGGISETQARRMLLEPVSDPEETIRTVAAAQEALTGRPAEICVLPQGPQTIPYVE
jgi:nickel-dependent lactate racemase